MVGVKREREEKAREKEREKEAKAKAKEAKAKEAKAILKGKGKSARRRNPRFDSPEPSTHTPNASAALRQVGSDSRTPDNETMDVDFLQEQPQDNNPNPLHTYSQDPLASRRSSSNLDMDVDKPPADTDMALDGNPRTTEPPPPSLSRHPSGQDSTQLMRVGKNFPRCTWILYS